MFPLVKDAINLTSKFTWGKLLGILKVLTSYFLSKLLKRPILFGLPFSMAFEPTTSCNLRCPECPSGLRSFTRPTGMLDVDFFKSKIEEVKNHLLYLTFYFQGEPYLHPQFMKMVKYASDRKIYTSTSTNAHYLDEKNARKTIESGLDRLIISLDGTTQETYKSYRVGGNIDKVLAGAKNIVRMKKELRSKTPHTVFQFLVVKPNEHQTEEVKRIAHDIGIDEVHFKTAQIYDYENGSPLIPENEKYSRYKKDENGKYLLKNPLDNHCWKMWHSCVITWDGKVVPCCFDKDANHAMGDLNESSFLNVWKNKKYTTFRKSILESRSKIDICQNCSEGMSVLG